MSDAAVSDTDGQPAAGAVDRLIWPPALWPSADREGWQDALAGDGIDGGDNPGASWKLPTRKKNADAYGRYLSWLHRDGCLLETERPAQRPTPERLKRFVASLKTHLAPVSIGMTIGALLAAMRAFAPGADWLWLSRRYSRLKARAAPSRDKRPVIQHSLDLYDFGLRLMRTADEGGGQQIRAAQRYQAGLIIALLAARPLRIRNFQAITVGESLQWDGTTYWLKFDTSKTGRSIDEPCPTGLVPYLEEFLRHGRPVLLKQAKKHAPQLVGHRRLWVDRSGKPMEEFTLRSMIERYTKAEFGTALWPHLFRDCLLTSVAIDQPDMIATSVRLLGHSSTTTGERHYNQAGMIDASRRYGLAMLELRESFLDVIRAQPAEDGAHT